MNQKPGTANQAPGVAAKLFTGEIRLVAATDGIAPAAPPAEIQIFPFGWVEFTETSGIAPVLVDEAGMSSAVARFAANRRDLVVDYEHQTEPGFARPDGRAPAAAWIKELFNRGKEGFWARVEWTIEAARLLAAKEYRYFSPVFSFEKATGRLTGIRSLALTNQPAMRGIRALVAKDSAGDARGKEETMNLLQESITLLGLPADAAPEAVLARVKELNAGAAAAKDAGTAAGAEGAAVREALGLAKDTTLADLTGTIAALRSRPGEELVAKVEALEAEKAERTARELVAAAKAEGKIAPANEEWALDYARKDPEGFKVFAAKAVRVVPLGHTPPGNPPDPAPTDLTPEQRAINLKCGVSDETWKKYATQ